MDQLATRSHFISILDTMVPSSVKLAEGVTSEAGPTSSPSHQMNWQPCENSSSSQKNNNTLSASDGCQGLYKPQLLSPTHSDVVDISVIETRYNLTTGKQVSPRPHDLQQVAVWGVGRMWWTPAPPPTLVCICPEASLLMGSWDGEVVL